MKYKIVTLGCKVNSYESEAVKQLLLQDGYLPCSENEEADLLIINTCSVTSVSDKKSRQKIRSEISKNKNATTVVMGCYAQINSNFVANIEGVDIVVGTGHRSEIPSLVAQFKKDKQKINLVNTSRDVPFEHLIVNKYSDNTRAFLKIQDGCDNFCSYCIIPYARGKMRSASKDEVLKEVHELVKNGFKEIVLTGIHTAGYGRDFDNYNFDDLLEDILKIEGLQRLRISSIEESEISDHFIKMLSENKILAHHLHIPLQAGSDHVLKLMNRKYTVEQFKEKINRIYEALPDISITTDIIVGFPNESEEDFQSTIQLARDCRFAKIHVFPFSPRGGTPAAKMAGQIDIAIKKDRVHRLLELSEELKEQYENKFVGKELEVLFEEYDEEKKMYKGHASNYIEVFYKSEVDLRNKLVTVTYKKLDSVQ